MSAAPSPTFGLVLAADDPAGLARFYGQICGSAAAPGLSASHWRVPLPGSLWLEVYAPGRSRPLPRQRGRLAVALQLIGGDGTRGRDHQGPEHGAQLEPARHESLGWEAWLNDPEGNALLLIAREARE